MGYITGKSSSKLAKVKVNLPLLFAVSVFPDVDLILSFLMHRGPTHSLITITVLMIPFFIVYRKQAIPYYAALLSHILIGDFFTGGVELFWPMSQGWFGVLNIEVNGLTNVVAELGLFFVTLPIMYKVGDFQSLLRPHNKNWALIIPLGAVLGPLLAVGRGQENTLPTLLVVPSLFYIGLFTYSMVVEFRAGHNQDADVCVFDKQTGARLFRASSSCASSIDHKANNRQNYPYFYYNADKGYWVKSQNPSRR